MQTSSSSQVIVLLKGAILYNRRLTLPIQRLDLSTCCSIHMLLFFYSFLFVLIIYFCPKQAKVYCRLKVLAGSCILFLLCLLESCLRSAHWIKHSIQLFPGKTNLETTRKEESVICKEPPHHRHSRKFGPSWILQNTRTSLFQSINTRAVWRCRWPHHSSMPLGHKLSLLHTRLAYLVDARGKGK